MSQVEASTENTFTVSVKLKKEVDDLVKLARENGYKMGWVMHQLEDIFDFSSFNLDEWSYIAEQLDYSSGWAFHKHKAFSRGEGNEQA